MSEGLKEGRVLRLKPGDAVYIESDAPTTPAEARRVAEGVRDWLCAAGHPLVPVMVLGAGHRLLRLAADEVDAGAPA